MNEQNRYPEQPNEQRDWLREKMENGQTSFYNKTVFLDLLILDKKKFKADGEELKELEREEAKLWANAGEKELRAWAKVNAREHKEGNASEEFFQAAKEKSLRAKVLLAKNQTSGDRASNAILDDFANTTDAELDEELSRGLGLSGKKSSSLQDKK